MSAIEATVTEEVGTHMEGVLSRSAVLMASKAGTWILAFVMTVMLPRYLGATGFGRLYFAISFTTMSSILVEFGLNSLVTREVARRPEEATRYLANAALIKTGLWAIAFAVVAVVVRLGSYPPETRIAVTVLAVGTLLTALDTLVTAVLQATDRARWVAASSLFEKAWYVGLGAAVLLLGYGVVAVAWVILFAAVAKLVLDLAWLRRLSHRVRLHSPWRGLEIAWLFRRAVPFFSMLFFGAIYFRMDVLIMSLLANDATVGHYGAAYRLFETTDLVPEAVMFALFPVFCRLSSRDDESLRMTAQKGMNILVLLGVPVATGVCVLADKIIGVLYGTGQYESSVLVLRILAVAIALMYVNGSFTQLLIATDRQRRLVVTAAVAAIVNVGMNLVLIPRLGAAGAALTTVVTEAVVICLNFSFLPREFTRQLRFAVPVKVMLSSLVMGLALVVLGAQPLVLLVIAGVAVYVAALVVVRALPAEDWAMMRRSLLKAGAA